jgi:hypothetical protein
MVIISSYERIKVKVKTKVNKAVIGNTVKDVASLAPLGNLPADI